MSEGFACEGCGETMCECPRPSRARSPPSDDRSEIAEETENSATSNVSEALSRQEEQNDNEKESKKPSTGTAIILDAKSKAFLEKYPSLRCPLGGIPMRDPVSAPNGATYEREEVMRRLDYFGYDAEQLVPNVPASELFSSLWEDFAMLNTTRFDSSVYKNGIDEKQ